MAHDKEVHDRLRRMETRLVKLFEFLGLDTQRQLPEWNDGQIEIPSMQTSIEDIVKAVPSGCNRPFVHICHKGAVVAHLYVDVKRDG